MINIFNKFDQFIYNKTLLTPFEISVWGNDAFDSVIMNDSFFKFAPALKQGSEDNSTPEVVIINGSVNKKQLIRLQEYVDKLPEKRMIVKMQGSIPEKIWSKSNHYPGKLEKLFEIDIFHNKYPADIEFLMDEIMQKWMEKFGQV